MKRTLLLGYPVAHSLSPRLHNAAFSALGMDWKYELLETPGDRLAQAVARVREPDCAGANITIPHKLAVAEWLDGLGETAQQVGAVNTLVKRNGRLIGENTDIYGFMRALTDAGVNPRGMRVVVLGAGGAARAVVFALARAGVFSVTILNRHPERAQALANIVRPYFPNLLLATNSSDDLKYAELIVNATSVGMWPHVHASPMPAGYRIRRGTVVYDLVYRPAETRFLKEARAAGAKTIGGIGMLVYQGAAAFKLWTGREAPVQVTGSGSWRVGEEFQCSDF